MPWARKIREPALVDAPGLNSWTAVLKNEPKLPGVEPTTGT